MTALIDRPDLNQRDARKTISKSFLVGADLCGEKAWRSVHDPRPFTPIEKVSFGSALDQAVDLAIGYIRSGQVIDMERVATAVYAVQERDGIEFDTDGAIEAAELFPVQVAPEYDFSLALTQHAIRVEIPGLGAVDGHPDVILPVGLYDVKSSAKAKPQDAARDSYSELGLYALMRRAETGTAPLAVGYWTWVRSKRPYWQIVTAPVTERMLRISMARASGYVRALEADAVLNEGLAVPVNGTFPGAPKFPGLCLDCPYSPGMGGDCEKASEVEGVAA